MRLRNFLIGIIALVLIPAVFLATALTYLSALEDQTEIVLERHLETARAVAIGFQEFIYGVVSTQQGVASAISLNKLDDDGIARFLDQVYQNNPEFMSLSYLDAKGRTLSVAGRPSHVVPTPELRRLKGKDWAVSKAYPQKELTSMFHIVSVIKKDGKTIGYIDSAIDDKTVLDIVDLRISGSGNTGIIDNTGNAIALSFRPEMEWRLRNRKFIPSIGKALRGQESTVRSFSDPIDGNTRMGASVPIEPLGWVANVFQPVDELRSPIRREALSRAAQWLSASLLISLVVGLLISQTITTPVRLLSEATAPFRKGDFKNQVNRRFRVRELNELSEAINKTASEVDNLFQQTKEISDTLQRSLAPQQIEPIPGYEIGLFYSSSTSNALVGGDFYDAFSIGGGLYGIAIGDIEGHGVEAAVSTAIAKFSLRDLAVRYNDPAEVLKHLGNRTYYGQSNVEEIRFFTMAFAALELTSGELSVAVAGHPPPLWCNGEECREIAPHGLILGLMPQTEYETGHTRLLPGEALVLYTDGVIESRYKSELYGEHNLHVKLTELWHLPANDIVNEIYRDCLRFAKGNIEDDLAILIVRRNAGDAGNA